MPSFLVDAGGMQETASYQAFQQRRDGTTMVTCKPIAQQGRDLTNDSTFSYNTRQTVVKSNGSELVRGTYAAINDQNIHLRLVHARAIFYTELFIVSITCTIDAQKKIPQRDS